MPFGTTKHDNACPLSAVDRRLADVHQLWHQAEQAYFDPEPFRLAIQNAIQTLRTVTFVLQKNKLAVPDFDAWYVQWQENLKSDGRMRWLVDARNKIEKQGDLEAKSFVRAEIVASHLDEGAAIEVPAELFEKIAVLLKTIPKNALGKHIVENGTLRIVRKWVENTLPDHELLDTVAHGYAFISRLVADAHKQAGLAEPGPQNQQAGEFVDRSALGGRLPCMIEHDEPRTILVSLRDGAVIHHENQQVRIDADKLEQAGKRYGVERASIGSRDFASDDELARAYFDLARTMFLKDGYHRPAVILLRKRKVVRVYDATAADQQQKYLLYRALAREAARNGADTVFAIHEVWIANAADVGPYEGASKSPNRTEALVLHAVVNDGDTFQLMASIKRVGDAVTLGDMDLTRGMAMFAMAPFLQVWGHSIPDDWRKALGSLREREDGKEG
jgi:hypothetical protein